MISPFARGLSRTLVLASATLLASSLAAQEEILEEEVAQEPAAEDELLFDDLLDDGLDDLLGGSDLSTTEDSTSEASALQGWKGFVSIKPRYFLNDRNQGRKDEQLILESQFELDFRFNDDTTAYFRPRIFTDAFDGELSRFEPFEVYATFESEDWDLRVGQFVENWGIADTYNPIDVINRRDYGTDILDPQRLGEMGLRWRWLLEGGETLGEPTLSLYALPVFRETRFAPNDQRFGFGSTDFRSSGGFEPGGLERAFFASRFQATLDTAPFNADLQFVAARGPERVPILTLAAPTLLLPVYFGANTFGAGIRAVPNEDVAGSFLSTLTLKAEVVYKDPFSFDNAPAATPDDYVAYVFGVDRSFFGVLRDEDELMLTLEYAGENGANDLASLLRPFRDDLILRTLWSANDFARQSVEFRFLIDLDVSENIFETIYERQLRSIDEDLKLAVQFQYFDRADPGESFFGFFPDNTSIAVGFTLDF